MVEVVWRVSSGQLNHADCQVPQDMPLPDLNHHSQLTLHTTSTIIHSSPSTIHFNHLLQIASKLPRPSLTSTLPQPSLTSTLPQQSFTATAPHCLNRHSQPHSTLHQPSLTDRAPQYLNLHSQPNLRTTSTITHVLISTLPQPLLTC